MCPFCTRRAIRYTRALYCSDRCAWNMRQFKKRHPEAWEARYGERMRLCEAARDRAIENAKKDWRYVQEMQYKAMGTTRMGMHIWQQRRTAARRN